MENKDNELEKFIEAVQLEMIESKLTPMRCVLCNTDTLERVLICPTTGERPGIVGVCEICQFQPEWEIEVSHRLAPYLSYLNKIRDEEEKLDSNDFL